MGNDDATQCPDLAASVCDVSNYTCTGCTEHDECGSGACNIDTNTCLDEGVIVYVDAAEGDDSATCGGPTDKCATIAFAITDRVDATRNTVIVAPGNYSEPLNITAGTITVVGKEEGDDRPIVDAPLGIPPLNAMAAVTVSGTANLTIDGVHVVPASGTTGTDAIRCTGPGATLSITRATVSNCALTLTQSTVSGNGGGGLDINNSGFSLTNNFIIRNGSDTSLKAGITVLNASNAMQRFDFNTVAGNRVGGLPQATNFHCGVTTPMTASSNIVYQGLTEGAQPSLLANGCAFDYSNIQGMITGTGGIDNDPLFVNPVAGPTADYHLKMTGPPSPCIDKADPAATLETFAVDIDGQDRFINGRSDIGADEVQ